MPDRPAAELLAELPHFYKDVSLPTSGVNVEIALNTHPNSAASVTVTTPLAGAKLSVEGIAELIRMLRNAQATIRRGNRK